MTVNKIMELTPAAARLRNAALVLDLPCTPWDQTLASEPWCSYSGPLNVLHSMITAISAPLANQPVDLGLQERFMRAWASNEQPRLWTPKGKGQIRVNCFELQGRMDIGEGYWIIIRAVEDRLNPEVWEFEIKVWSEHFRPLSIFRDTTGHWSSCVCRSIRKLCPNLLPLRPILEEVQAELSSLCVQWLIAELGVVQAQTVEHRRGRPERQIADQLWQQSGICHQGMVA